MVSESSNFDKLKLLSENQMEINFQFEFVLKENGFIKIIIDDLDQGNRAEFIRDDNVESIFRTDDVIINEVLGLDDVFDPLKNYWGGSTKPKLKSIPNTEFFNVYPESTRKAIEKNNTISQSDYTSIFLKSITSLYKLLVLFPEVLNKFIDVYHIKSVRKVPRDRYLLENDQFPNKVHYPFNQYLTEEQYLGFDEYRRNQQNQRQKHEFKLDYVYWSYLFIHLRNMNLANGVFTKKANGIGEVIVENTNKSFVGLSQSSSGLLQILPILTLIKDISTFEYELIPNNILIEQPELHLHPKVQSQLADIFNWLVKIKSRNFNYIIETHSEHMVRKLQVLYAKGEIDPNDFIIYYFDNSKGTSEAIEMKLDKYGLFIEKWPHGFFDDKMNLTFELLDVIRDRSN